MASYSLATVGMVLFDTRVTLLWQFLVGMSLKGLT